MTTDTDNPPGPSTILRTVAILGACYTIIAWLTIEFIQKRTFTSIFDSQTSVGKQLLIGTAAGTAFAGVQWLLLVIWPRWNEAQRRAVAGSAGLFRSPLTILLVALIVGITEEILFRAAIQPLTGIVIAAILFTVVHLGNLRSLGGRDAGEEHDPITLIAAVAALFSVSLLVGILFDSFGLLASMAAHFFYDAIVLLVYRAHFSNGSLRSGEAETENAGG